MGIKKFGEFKEGREDEGGRGLRRCEDLFRFFFFLSLLILFFPWYCYVSLSPQTNFGLSFPGCIIRGACGGKGTLIEEVAF